MHNISNKGSDLLDHWISIGRKERWDVWWSQCVYEKTLSGRIDFSCKPWEKGERLPVEPISLWKKPGGTVLAWPSSLHHQATSAWLKATSSTIQLHRNLGLHTHTQQLVSADTSRNNRVSMISKVPLNELSAKSSIHLNLVTQDEPCTQIKWQKKTNSSYPQIAHSLPGKKHKRVQSSGIHGDTISECPTLGTGGVDWKHK